MERIDGQEKFREKQLGKYRTYRQSQGGRKTRCAGESQDEGLDTSTPNQLKIILRILQKLFLKTVRKNVLMTAHISNSDNSPSYCALWFPRNVCIFSPLCCSQPNLERKWAGKKVQSSYGKLRFGVVKSHDWVPQFKSS